MPFILMQSWPKIPYHTNNFQTANPSNHSQPVKTRPEVSKLTQEHKINSQVTKLSPSESSEATNRLTDTQNYIIILSQFTKIHGICQNF